MSFEGFRNVFNVETKVAELLNYRCLKMQLFTA
jgi:hypothetical protein